MSVEDLKKALDKFSSGLILYEPITYDENMLLVSIRADFEDVLQMFSVFQKDYDLQVHVSRKQLSELINKYPSYRLMSRHPTVREFTDFILLRDDHFEKLKELFEATQK